MTRKLLRCFPFLLAVLGLLCSVNAANAQAVSGSISGTVTDPSGAVVIGATVTLTNTDRGAVIREVRTGPTGFYTAQSLPLGTYTVSIVSSGFKTTTVTGLVLNVNDALTVNRALVAGGANESVIVTAAEAQINLQSASSEGLIDSNQIGELALLTRNYEALLTLQPGVSFGGSSDQLGRGPTNPSGASNQVNFAINGGRNTQNNWTIDGADNVDRGANLTLYVYPSPDAIAQFKVLRAQYSAEFGRNASGQVDVVTKSGTNSIHGSAYEYLRNDFFDANGYYNNFMKKAITKYRYNDFGFSFGGPVYIPKAYNGRNKTFFFVSEEFWRDITYTTGTALVPTMAERSGDFSNSGYKTTAGAWTTGPVNVCTAFTYSAGTSACTATGTKITTIDPVSQAYLKDVFSVIPAPQSAIDLANNVDPHTLTSTIPNRFNNDNTVVRVDEQLGQKLSVFYRFMHDTYPVFQGSGTFVQSPIPGLSATNSNSPGTQHLGHGTWIISPTLLANFGYAYSNGSILTQPQGALLNTVSTDINPTLIYANTVGVVPTIGISGMTTLGGGAVYVDHGINHQIFGDISKVLHNHTLKVGVSYNHYQKRENANGGGNQGSFTFSNDTQYPIVTNPLAQTSTVYAAQGFANFLMGNANGGFSQSSKNIVADIHTQQFEAYFQDDWKILPRLTLNIGVRYSYFGQPTDAAGNLSSFDPSSYSAAKAPTITSKGAICFTGTCSQAGSNAGLSTSPNANADYVGPNYLNGMIFGTPSSSNNNQASSYGSAVGKSQKLNFAPRFGFAYDLFGNGKTSLRGGFGLGFDQVEISEWENAVFSNPPAVSTYSLSQALFDNPTGGAASTAPSTNPGHLYVVPEFTHTPYVEQYSLDIQHQMTPTLAFDVAYVGSHGVHLYGEENLNQPKPGAWIGVVSPTTSLSTCVIPGTTTPAFMSTTCDLVLNQIKPYLGYYGLDTTVPAFGSNYNSLQAKVTKHFKGKTFIDANYTWSRNLSNAMADYTSSIQDIYNPDGDYGRASDDRKHILSIDGVWEEPFFRDQKDLKGRLLGGWEVSAVFAANSGLPLTVSGSGGGQITYNIPGGATSIYNNSTTGGYLTDNAGLAALGNVITGLRPNQIGDPNHAPAGIQLHNKAYGNSATPWFYTGAFAAPAPNSPVPGTTHRGSVNGPGFYRFDLGIFRNFRIYDRLTFQLRGEAFNATNHTNVQSVGTTSTSSTFGQVTGYRDPRIVQVAGKFTF